MLIIIQKFLLPRNFLKLHFFFLFPLALHTVKTTMRNDSQKEMTDEAT